MRYSKVLSTMLVFGLGLASVSSQAQNPNVVYTVGENGIGNIVGVNGQVFPLTASVAPDPGPGGLPSTLTYNLGGPPSLVAGDLFLTDPGGGGTQDVIRFNPAGTGGPNYPASLVFYSDNVGGADSLADTPSPPGSFYTNTFTLPEVGIEGFNGAVYTPVAGQPGFVAGFNVTYNILSDVPEPGSVALFVGMGLGGSAFFARHRKRARKVA